MTTLKSSTSRAFASLAIVATLVIALIGLPIRVDAQRKTFAKVTPGSSTPLSVVPSTPTGAGQRTSINIQNVGTVNVGFGSTSSITYATGYTLAPNQQMLCTGDTDNLYAIAASSTADLRILATYSNSGTGSSGVTQCSISRLNTTGITNSAANTTVGMSDGSNIVAGNVLVYLLTSAITANSTTTSTASGTLAITSNATGLGSIFRSDGTNWQLLNNYAQYGAGSAPITIATTSTSDMYLTAPVTGNLTGIDFTSLDALAASDTNYITYTAVNLGQSGVGTTAMLAVSDANTTKTTGGTALTALARRTLTIHGTAGNLAVVKGDVIRVRATATGTLVGTVTLSRAYAYFTRTV